MHCRLSSVVFIRLIRFIWLWLTILCLRRWFATFATGSSFKNDWCSRLCLAHHSTPTAVDSFWLLGLIEVFYFDAGASLILGIRAVTALLSNISSIYAFEPQTSNDNFYSTIPIKYQSHTHLKQCTLAGDSAAHSDEHPFLPVLINAKSRSQDYVVVNMDLECRSQPAETMPWCWSRTPIPSMLY